MAETKWNQGLQVSKVKGDKMAVSYASYGKVSKVKSMKKSNKKKKSSKKMKNCPGMMCD